MSLLCSLCHLTIWTVLCKDLQPVECTPPNILQSTTPTTWATWHSISVWTVSALQLALALHPPLDTVKSLAAIWAQRHRIPAPPRWCIRRARAFVHILSTDQVRALHESLLNHNRYATEGSPFELHSTHNISSSSIRTDKVHDMQHHGQLPRSDTKPLWTYSN